MIGEESDRESGRAGEILLSEWDNSRTGEKIEWWGRRKAKSLSVQLRESDKEGEILFPWNDISLFQPYSNLLIGERQLLDSAWRAGVIEKNERWKE